MRTLKLQCSYDSNIGIGDGWKYKFNREGYDFYAKMENGVTSWKAIKQEAGDVSEAFDVTYKQARGFEPINETALQKWARKTLKMDEWDKVNSSKLPNVFRKGDRIKYECGFDNKTGRFQFDDGVVLDSSRRSGDIIYRVKQSDGKLVTVNEHAIQSTNMNCSRDGHYKLIRHKYVEDSDGFLTDYAMYEMPDGNYVFIFGDTDLYNPDNTEWDWEAETREQADEWFDNYSTEWDEDLDSSTRLYTDNYGNDSNGDPIDESTVEELARIADETLHDNLENAEWFDTVAIDEASFEDNYYLTGTAFGADVDYNIVGTLDTREFDVTDCYKDNWDGLAWDYSANSDNYALIDFVINVKNTDMTMDLDNFLVTCYEWFDGSYSNNEYEEQQFTKAFDVNKLSEKILKCFDKAVPEIQIVVSNL